MPAGKYLGEAFHRAGGVPTVMRELLAKNKIHGNVMTVTGKTYGENLKGAKPADGDVIMTYDKPMLGQAGFAVLSGNLFDSAIMKTSVISPEFRQKYLEKPGDKDAFEGTAIVFEGPEDYHHRINDPSLPIDENSILFIRYTGPVGYPGAAEVVNMLPPDRLVKGGVLLLPCVGDGRQSGTSASPSILNASPEAAVGGGLALLETGDKVRVDIGKRTANILITDAELAKRKAAWKPNIRESQTPWQELQRKYHRPARLAAPASTSRSTTRRSPRPRECRGTRTRRVRRAPAKKELTEEALLDRDGQVGAVDQHDRPRRGRRPHRRRGRAAHHRRRAGLHEAAGTRRGEVVGDAIARTGRQCARGRLHAYGRRGRWHRALCHHVGRRPALLEHQHDAIAPAHGLQDIHAVAGPIAQAEEDADGVDAAGLEDVRGVGADAGPQAAPFGHRVGDNLVRLAHEGGGALPLVELDALRRRARGDAGYGDDQRRDQGLDLAPHASSSFPTWHVDQEAQTTITVWLNCGGRRRPSCTSKAISGR